ncbi:unnamed protein product [Paramecium sonneborni]|uniref:Transmembrane protein n=1 Tax=Paramecium sonneborni TaxID=65129 RepID=A0A8S1QGA1_9CILI|nr:unnamed protein product [Paramecium sonneborni]
MMLIIIKTIQNDEKFMTQALLMILWMFFIIQINIYMEFQLQFWNYEINSYFKFIRKLSKGNNFIIVFYEIPLGCGIQFKCNNTYVGSIFKNNSGVQLHYLGEFSYISLGPNNSYQSSIKQINTQEQYFQDLLFEAIYFLLPQY